MMIKDESVSKKLSICIICKNESDKIDSCLKSVAWADEIVVLDSGSTDDTLEIARRYTDNIFVRDDWAGFGEQRRRAEELATNDWVFAIDCDEIVSPELKDVIVNQLNAASNDDVLYLNRLTHFCGQFIYHSGWYPDRIARIYNKTKYRYNTKLVHESVDCKDANKVQLVGNLEHYQYDDLFQYINKRNGYAKFGANDKRQHGKKTSLLKATGSALFAFFRHYVLKRGFLDGRVGFIIAIIQMQYTFNKYLLISYGEEREGSKI
jgi:(heptosyl)LPS beta-1,4-glucosyltransferase